MQLDFAFLADAAQVVGGKLYVIGGVIERIAAKQAPVVHPHLTLVLRLAMTPAESDRTHQLEVVILDGDGKKIGGASGQLRVDGGEAPGGWRGASPILALNIANAKFERFGPYAIELLVNGTSLKSLPVEVVESPRP